MGSEKQLEIKRCSRWRVVEIKRVHCNYKQIFVWFLFYQSRLSKILFIHNTSAVESFSNIRCLEPCLILNNLSSFLVIQDLIKAKNSCHFENFFNFSSQISLFSTLAFIIAAIFQARMSKDSQIELFLFLSFYLFIYLFF